ncbi:hypothetical protein SELMODRAFT_413039 [Selaginella moellendorffii]|uniref:TF-B3 domain-containing protein n=1 Tax=Selaginella moellendorffii TaxID=88036 RepID=D8RN53_SELML|nr:hypothetical protein SELMODRAFT_413039 [Selaginella moellendorffii]
MPLQAAAAAAAGVLRGLKLLGGADDHTICAGRRGGPASHQLARKTQCAPHRDIYGEMTSKDFSGLLVLADAAALQPSFSKFVLRRKRSPRKSMLWRALLWFTADMSTSEPDSNSKRRVINQEAGQLHEKKRRKVVVMDECQQLGQKVKKLKMGDRDYGSRTDEVKDSSSSGEDGAIQPAGDTKKTKCHKWRPRKREDPLVTCDPSRWALLFDKKLTASDVNSLHRLLIPVKYESILPNDQKVLVEFVDEEGGVWELRCKKGKTGSLITTHWIHYVREHSLKEGDTVCFYKKVSSADPKF